MNNYWPTNTPWVDSALITNSGSWFITARCWPTTRSCITTHCCQVTRWPMARNWLRNYLPTALGTAFQLERLVVLPDSSKWKFLFFYVFAVRRAKRTIQISPIFSSALWPKLANWWPFMSLGSRTDHQSHHKNRSSSTFLNEIQMAWYAANPPEL